MINKIFFLIVFLFSLKGFSQDKNIGIQGSVGRVSFGGFLQKENFIIENNIYFKNSKKESSSGTFLNLLLGYRGINDKYFSCIFKTGYFVGIEGKEDIFTNGIWFSPEIEIKITNEKCSFFVNTNQLFFFEKEVTKYNPEFDAINIGIKFYLKKYNR